MVSSIKLKESKIVRYSPMEKALFTLLKNRPNKTASTEWLTEHVYKYLEKTPPQSGRIVLTGVLRSFIKKTKENNEPFRIICSPAAGPYSTEVKIELPD